MPGREDYAKISSNLLSDDRAHDAAELYVKHGIATEETALAAVVGHVAMLGLWALRETDNGVLPGDGMRALRFAIPAPNSVLKVIRDALKESKLLRNAGRNGLYVVGFRSTYESVITRRKKDRRRKRDQRKKADSGSKRPQDSPQDIPPTSAGQSTGRPEDVQAQSSVAESREEERSEAESREARPSDELTGGASLCVSDGERKPSGLLPGQRLSEKAWVAVGAILDQLATGTCGVDVQTQALCWRQLHRNGALNDATGAMLLDRYKKRFGRAIAEAKHKEGIA